MIERHGIDDVGLRGTCRLATSMLSLKGKDIHFRRVVLRGPELPTVPRKSTGANAWQFPPRDDRLS